MTDDERLIDELRGKAASIAQGTPLSHTATMLYQAAKRLQELLGQVKELTDEGYEHERLWNVAQDEKAELRAMVEKLEAGKSSCVVEDTQP